MRKRIILALLLAAVCLLAGCELRTVDQMYCLPKRPQSYNDLQSTIDSAMEQMEYSAPRAGENQQTVQMVDLDGDGNREYLLFARGEGDRLLRILIFAQVEQSYALVDTVQCNGSSFDVVEYAQLDGTGGMEILVGCQLSDQVPRSVSVYAYADGQTQQMLSKNYTKFLTCDLDLDGREELFIVSPGMSDGDDGVAELYTVKDGAVHRFNEAEMSAPADMLNRLIAGQLSGGKPAVYVSSKLSSGTIVTDIYTLQEGAFINVSLFNKKGTRLQTLRSFDVYPDDVDDDGEVELPALISMKPIREDAAQQEQHLIRWYAIGPDGSEANKLYTYHNFVSGWYLQLQPEWVGRISVVQEGNDFLFYLWDEQRMDAAKIFSIHVLRGQNREEQAVQDNRFAIYKNESVIYAARLEVASGALRITQDDLINCFHLILQDWKFGEM